MAQYIREFANLSDWIAYAESPCDSNSRNSQRTDYSMVDFSGTPSFLVASKMLREGWVEGRQRMQRILDDVRNTIFMQSPVYNFVAAIDGCAPHVEAFLQGEPENMFHLQEEISTVPPSHLTVQLEFSASCHTDPVQMTWSGAVLFAAIEALKGQGCAVSILMSHTVRNRKSEPDFWQSIVPLPSSVDTDTAAFLFTHPSTLRRFAHSIREHDESDIRRNFGFYIGGGYGVSSNLKNPKANVLLIASKMASSFSVGNEQHNLTLAQQFIKNLVDSKFCNYLNL